MFLARLFWKSLCGICLYINRDSGSYAMNTIFLLYCLYVKNGTSNPYSFCNFWEHLTRHFHMFLYTRRIRKDCRFQILVFPDARMNFWTIKFSYCWHETTNFWENINFRWGNTNIWTLRVKLPYVGYLQSDHLVTSVCNVEIYSDLVQKSYMKFGNF